MAITDQIITIAGLVEITLPAEVVRLCDGGFINWPARGIFSGDSATLGTIDSVSAIGEAVGDEAPQGSLTLLLPDSVTPGSLFLPAAQGGAMYFWQAEVSEATGQIIGTPDLLFSGYIDTLKLRIGGQTRSVEITFISEAERLFAIREGNVFSARWHKSIWPGETGLDHATGTQTTVPWGINAPRGQALAGGTVSLSQTIANLIGFR